MREAMQKMIGWRGMGMGKRGSGNPRSTGLPRQSQSTMNCLLCSYLDNKSGMVNIDYGQSEAGVVIVGKGKKAESDDKDSVNSEAEFGDNSDLHPPVATLSQSQKIELTIKKQRHVQQDENSDPKGKKGLVPAISAMSKGLESLAASMEKRNNPVAAAAASENSKIKQLLATLVQKNNTLETAVSQMAQIICNINSCLKPPATLNIYPAPASNPSE
ncbi:hypothetical protein HDU78_011755 [Chytriomyces hyalinus]|nr:hypothetical protein HDU78_011755 [Chytriomyces hyalinus]